MMVHTSASEASAALCCPCEDMVSNLLASALSTPHDTLLSLWHTALAHSTTVAVSDREQPDTHRHQTLYP